jgi:DNA-binding beta-propeller fold protein YncE
MKFFSAIFFFFSVTAFCQTYTFDFSFGKFQKASSFHLNSAGFFFITDSGNDRFYKFDSLGANIEETGGYGWQEETFDDPVDVFATTLNIYVCDKNNHRIQRFDKDLNFISQLSTRESENEDEQFGYPLACATSAQGDLFILDSENKRILKFDLFGNFIQNFGGMDAGSFSLNNPMRLAVSASDKIFVVDGSDIVVFDNYGNGMAVIDTKLELKGMEIYFNFLSVNTGTEIFSADLKTSGFELKKVNLAGLDYKPEFVASIVKKTKLYILTEKEVLVFTSTK